MLFDADEILFPFTSNAPPSWGVVSPNKSVGMVFTLAFAPVPSAKTIADVPVAIATVLPDPPPCFTVAVCPVPFFIKYHFKTLIVKKELRQLF